MDEKKHKEKTKVKRLPKVEQQESDDENDFGGLPSTSDLRKNIGCGG